MRAMPLILAQSDGAAQTPPLVPVPEPNGLLPPAPALEPERAIEILHGYLPVFIVAFVVTLCVTPLMRSLAVRFGIVDRPTESRKGHSVPVAYLGGLAVFIGVMAAIAFSYIASGAWFATIAARINPDFEFLAIHLSQREQAPVNFVILLGMTVIMLTGLIDDVGGLAPRIKIGGQLLAAAALAMQDIGTKVAAGVLKPIGSLFGNQDMVFHIPLPDWVPFSLGPPTLGPNIEIDIIYWTGVAIIALFVLGACNASNLVDGLDGLLSGVTAISAAGLLVIALWLAQRDDGQLDSSRIMLCLAVMGACLGFLPHNFNPATIFLGDAGSLLLGYLIIVIVLMLGDTGQTHLVVAGLIIYSVPIIDTALAMVRRALAGKAMSTADDQHLHHILKRSLGVKGAALATYGIAAVFAALGVWLSMGRVRVVFTIALVIAAFIGVTAVKAARRQLLEAQALAAGSAPPRPPRPSISVGQPSKRHSGPGAPTPV